MGVVEHSPPDVGVLGKICPTQTCLDRYSTEINARFNKLGVVAIEEKSTNSRGIGPRHGQLWRNGQASRSAQNHWQGKLGGQFKSRCGPH